MTALAAAILLLGIGLPGLLFVLPYAARKLAERKLTSACERDRILVLTYDDGPGAELTGALLETLQRHRARATFFPLGRRAEADPDVLDRVAEAGHEIGVHSHEHRNAWKVGPLAARDDARQGYQTLARWVGASGLFRPPHGKLDALTWWDLRRRGARLGWWTLDSGDTAARLPEPEQIVARVVAAGGGVVLLHDFDRAEERGRFVLDVTEGLLEAARRERLEIRTLGALLTDSSA